MVRIFLFVLYVLKCILLLYFIIISLIPFQKYHQWSRQIPGLGIQLPKFQIRGKLKAVQMAAVHGLSGAHENLFSAYDITFLKESSQYECIFNKYMVYILGAGHSMMIARIFLKTNISYNKNVKKWKAKKKCMVSPQVVRRHEMYCNTNSPSTVPGKM